MRRIGRGGKNSQGEKDDLSDGELMKTSHILGDITIQKLDLLVD